MSQSYEEFVASKLSRVPPTGMAEVPELSDKLFPFQRDIVGWALRRGRAAVFASTGLGKMRIEIEWARCVSEHTGGRVLIFAPLAVAAQIVREGEVIGVNIKLCREASDVTDGINVTNYDRMHKFDAAMFAGLVLDESSAIKGFSSKTTEYLFASFAHVQFKLAATATPAPNDYTELGTHAEFLGICKRTEMLAEYFTHDSGETQSWRLKGHARVAFWRWVSTWGALVRKPSDLGYDDGAYSLPPLTIHHHVAETNQAETFAAGNLFAAEATDLMSRRRARKASVGSRVAACVRQVCEAEPTERYVVWCDLNSEQDELAKAFGDDCFSVYGSLDADEKERRLLAYVSGERRVLLGKPSIFGHGLNIQSAARMAFVGVTDSWEAYYQAVRRCWRFGQTRPVDVHIFTSEAEGAVVKNLERKERDALAMGEQLANETRDSMLANVRGLVRETNAYQPAKTLVVPSWLGSQCL